MLWDDTIRALRRLVAAVRESYTAEVATLEDLDAAQQIAAWVGGNATADNLAVGEDGQTHAQAVGQRDALFALAANAMPGMAWKSLMDADGESLPAGQMLGGIETLSGSLVLKLPLRYNSILHCPALPKAREGVDGGATEEAILEVVKQGCLPY